MAKQIRAGGQPATKPAPAAPVPRPRPKPDPAAELVVKYTAFGWNISARPRRNINDFVATKGDKLHFIQLVAPDDQRMAGERRGTFIQNAFSNDAVPVYAEVSPRGVSLTDANTGARVGLGRIGGLPADTKNN